MQRMHAFNSAFSPIDMQSAIPETTALSRTGAGHPVPNRGKNFEATFSRPVSVRRGSNRAHHEFGSAWCRGRSTIPDLRQSDRAPNLALYWSDLSGRRSESLARPEARSP
jgi:hypothetical protein